jgi:hypothetical protein
VWEWWGREEGEEGEGEMITSSQVDGVIESCLAVWLSVCLLSVWGSGCLPTQLSVYPVCLNVPSCAWSLGLQPAFC